jgi:hypothetical protein
VRGGGCYGTAERCGGDRGDGAIPQNVNYAVKSAFVLPFVENIPEIKQTAKPVYKDRAEIIEQMKKATVLVICY